MPIPGFCINTIHSANVYMATSIVVLKCCKLFRTGNCRNHALFTSFVRSLWAWVQPTLGPSAETFWIETKCQPRERRGVDMCVWCACYVWWRRESKLEQVFPNAPPPTVAYCLTKPGLALVQWQPWSVHHSAPGKDWPLRRDSPTGLPFSARPPDWHFCSISQEAQSHLSASALTSARLISWRC